MKKIDRSIFTIFLLVIFLGLSINMEVYSEKAESEFVTDDTFLNTGGSYTLEYILNRYNVFSFGDVSGPHIVGPIVAKGQLSHSGDKNKGMNFSNFSNGVSSYIGGKVKPGTKITSLEIRYLKDIDQGQVDIPKQYVGMENTIITKDGAYKLNGDRDQYIPTNHVFRTDKYIDWNTAKNSFIDQSQKVLRTAKTTIAKEDIVGFKARDSNVLNVLYVDEGSNILIPGSLLDKIDWIILVTDNITSSPKTIVNIDGAGPYTMPGVRVSKDRQSIGDNLGTNLFNENDRNGWFTKKGIGLVFNLPAAKKVTFENSKSAIGHVVAPQADVYHYSGNYDGSYIVNSLESTSEGHMHPYNGGDLISKEPEDPAGKPGTEEPEVPEEKPGTEEPEVPEEKPGTEEPEVPEEKPGTEEPEVPEEKPGTEEPEVPEEKPGTEEPEVPEEKPEPEDPAGKPGTEEPEVPEEKPGTEEPEVPEEKPGTEEPEVPAGKPGTEEPEVPEEKPGTEEPEVPEEKPGTEEPEVPEEKPGTEEPEVPEEKPGTEEPEVPEEKPGTEEPEQEDPGRPIVVEPVDPEDEEDSTLVLPGNVDKEETEDLDFVEETVLEDEDESEEDETLVEGKTVDKDSVGKESFTEAKVEGKETLPKTGEDSLDKYGVVSSMALIAIGFFLRKKY